MTKISVTGGLTNKVLAAEKAVQVCNSKMSSIGGFIVNPLLAKDQALAAPASLYVSILQPPLRSGVDPRTGTAELLPGCVFVVPPFCNAYVVSKFAGHTFSSVFSGAPVNYPPQPVPGNFPPAGPTGLLDVIPSYLYQEYSDDDDLQNFVSVQNSIQQDYVDTFNGLNLPIYTGTIIKGALADWVMEGLYGYKRPTMFATLSKLLGPLNTFTPNPQLGVAPITIDGIVFTGPQGQIIADDDLYKRCLTWHYQKGDGKYFNVRWLKRRVMRFIIGSNGTSPNINNTDQISVTFGALYEVTIRFVLFVRTVTGGSICNMFGCNGTIAGSRYNIVPLNSIRSTLDKLPPLPYMTQFQQAVQSGVLELPFQFKFDVYIDGSG